MKLTRCKLSKKLQLKLLEFFKELFDGEIELDESYFGGIRKGKRGCGAGGKTAVFGLLKRNGKVYTFVVKDTKTDTLMPSITSKIKPNECLKSTTALTRNIFIFLSKNVSFALTTAHPLKSLKY